MKKINVFILFLLLTLFSSCEQIKEYFKDPETEPIKDLLKTSRLIGYVSQVAMTAINGNSDPNVHVYRSGSGYPCTAFIVIKPDRAVSSFMRYNPGKILAAGYWPDEETAIISFLMPNSSLGLSGFSLKNICTVPVMRYEDGIFAVFAGIDINVEENGENILKIDFSEDEKDEELERLNMEEPEDIELAVEENAWIIHVDDNFTNDFYDDTYTVTGGGQLITADNTSMNAYQQAVLQVKMDHFCNRNPVSGYALIQKAAVEDEKFPETGQAIFSFNDRCNGRIKVEIATGSYIASIGKELPFEME